MMIYWEDNGDQWPGHQPVAAGRLLGNEVCDVAGLLFAEFRDSLELAVQAALAALARWIESEC